MLVPYIREGLAAGDKCICVMDGPDVDGPADAFGPPSEGRSEAHPHLEMCRSEDTYLADGSFPMDATIEFWDESGGAAVTDGSAPPAAVRAEAGTDNSRIGIGTWCPHPGEIPRTCHDASVTLSVSRRVQSDNRVTYYEDLGAYRLRCEVQDPAVVDRFVRRWLGTLPEDDERRAPPSGTGCNAAVTCPAMTSPRRTRRST